MVNVRLAVEPTVDGVVKAIQLARARAKYQGFMKGVTVSLMDIQWLLEQTKQGSKNEGALDIEGEMLVKRYLEMEVPYRLQQMEEYLEALDEAGANVGELGPTLEGFESERGRFLERVRSSQSEERETAKVIPEELAGFVERLDSLGKELEKQAHDFLLSFIQNNMVSKELAISLLEGEELG